MPPTAKGVVDMKNLIRNLFTLRDREELLFGVARSTKWASVRNKFLKTNTKCVVCGSLKNLVVHHKLPFHLYPELELDVSNLVTLCESSPVNCHFLFGHLMDWKKYNPDVDYDVFTWAKKLGKVLA